MPKKVQNDPQKTKKTENRKILQNKVISLHELTPTTFFKSYSNHKIAQYGQKKKLKRPQNTIKSKSQKTKNFKKLKLLVYMSKPQMHFFFRPHSYQ